MQRLVFAVKKEKGEKGRAERQEESDARS